MPTTNDNQIFTIWINKNPPDLILRCWNSWIENGYNVLIYVDDAYGKNWKLPPKLLAKIQVKHLRSLGIKSFDYSKGKLLHLIDLWRFMILKDLGGTWLDSDVFLIGRLPHNPIIISSEHTLKAGAFKSKIDRKANIGCLRFPPRHPFTLAVVEKMLPETKEDLNDGINMTSKMLKFIKLLKTRKWSYMNKYIVEPQMFCPIPWCFAKEIYMADKSKDFKPKYGLEFDYTDETTAGIHMWNNLAHNKHKIDFTKINKESLFAMIS